jgi:predicted transcriptional regulator
MSVMSIRIDDNKRKVLKVIASLEGKTMGGIVGELIDDYIKRNKEKIIELSEKENLNEIMKLSEASFMEWDNTEDEIYNNL